MMFRLKFILNLAVRNLIRNHRRTMAVLLTIAFGTGSLFIFDGFNFGIMNQYRENTIHGRYGHGEINTKGYLEKVYEKPWEHWIEDSPSVIQKAKSLPGVTRVFPRIGFYGLLTNGQITLSGRGQGIDGVEEAAFFTSLNVEEGQQLTSEQDGVLLGKGLARSLNAHVGDRITVLTNTIEGSINGADLTVVGIFHTGAKDFDDVVFKIPLKVAQTLLNTQKVESIALGLKGLNDWTPVSTALVAAYPNLEAVPFAELDKVYYQHAVDWLASQFRVIKSIILLIVILGIFNTISTGVLERKQEVGNLRANGESSREVMALFLTEGIVIGVTGALIGIFLTLLINKTLLAGGILMPPSPGLTRQYHVFVELRSYGAFQTFALGTVCALFGTFLATLRVTRMPIGVALKSI